MNSIIKDRSADKNKSNYIKLKEINLTQKYVDDDPKVEKVDQIQSFKN